MQNRISYFEVNFEDPGMFFTSCMTFLSPAAYMWSFTSLVYLSVYVCLACDVSIACCLFTIEWVCVCVCGLYADTLTIGAKGPESHINLITTGKSLNSSPNNPFIQSREGDSLFREVTDAQGKGGGHYWSVIGFYLVKTSINIYSNMWLSTRDG